MISIERLTTSSETAVADINALLVQLRSNPMEHEGSVADLEEVVQDPSIYLIVAKDGERIVGMGSLYTALKVGKRSGYLEDIVVDSGYRGQRLGEKITAALIEAARAERLKQLYLTSRPDRTPAHHLYEKLGFRKHETFVFRLEL